MDINSAIFTISSTKLSGCPTDGLPEYAFIGRSNVGKSSLINMLANDKILAKTSSRPGKTLLINHFLVNDSWYIVDLPGYGYAKTSKSIREGLHKMINAYSTKRENLACMFVLIDSRHEPMEIDLDFLQFLGEEGVPFAVVFTKTDKISQAVVGDNVSKFRKRMLEIWDELPPFFQTSSEKRRGRKELLDYIESINKSLAESV